MNISMTVIAAKTALLAHLTNIGILHTTHEHRAIFTVEEGQDIKATLPGGHTKNLFLKDKKGAFFLICALGGTKISINQLHKHLGCKRLSFGKPEALLEHLGVVPGSVTLFSVINDKNNTVTLILDKALFNHEIVNFHPLTNTATTAIASSDIEKFTKSTHHDFVIIDFAALEAPHAIPT